VAYGAAPTDIAIASHQLALTLADMRRYDEARLHFERALRVIEEAQGEDHPRCGDICADYGYMLWELGEYDEALRYQKRGWK